jgi:hypothetical protein
MEKTERKVYVCFYAASIFVDLYARMYNHILTVAADGHDCESEHAAELGMILSIIWWKYCKPKQSELIVGLARQLQLMNSGSDRGPSAATSASRKICQGGPSAATSASRKSCQRGSDRGPSAAASGLPLALFQVEFTDFPPHLILRLA